MNNNNVGQINNGFHNNNEGYLQDDDPNYNSFEGDTPENIEDDFLKNALGGEVTPEPSEDVLFEQNLKMSLPSSELRKVHALARSGTLKRLKLKPQNEIDNLDGPKEDLPTSSTAVDMGIDGEIYTETIKVDRSELDQIRDMSTTITRKRTVRNRVREYKQSRPLSSWQDFRLGIAMKRQKLKDSIKDTFSSIDMWRGHLKEVEGLFGTGVLSYFTFLRWLLYINLMILLLTLSFLFVPQMIHGQSIKTINKTFNGLELLTGEGWFNHTELFYGTYTSQKVKDKYDMKYAYLFTGTGYSLLCIMILVVSIANSYKEHFISSDGSIASFSSKVFCSWDYTISNLETAKINQKSIVQDMLETLGSQRRNVKASCCILFGIFLLRLLTNLIVIAFMAGSAYLIYFVSERSVEYKFPGRFSEADNTIKSMVPALTISAVNLIIPTGFRLIASVESYHSPRNELAINLIRTITLKLVSLIVYIATLYIQLTKVEHLGEKCWENFIGQAFYKLMIIDFIAVLLSTFFEEFLRKVFSSRFVCCERYSPGFDISKNVMNLIYGQGICWMGTFYCPLLPLINVFKLVITFYVKKVSVVNNCRPSMRPFKASKMMVWFMLMLSLMLALTLIVIGYIVMADNTLKPSNVCGPFINQKSIYSLVLKVIEELPNTIRQIINVVTSLSVIAAIIFLTALLAYYFRLRKISSEKKIKLLKQQLSLAGRDKQYLIRKLRNLLKSTHVE